MRTLIRTREVPNNTRLYWSLSGDDIDSEDLSKGSLTGSGLVKKNKFSIKHTLAKDLLTEGNETLEIKLFTDAALTEQVGETKEVVIVDKSKSPLSSARLFSDSGEDKLYGDRGDDNLRGDSTADYLYGVEGNIKLYSEEDNTLIGGIGEDDLYGGSGNEIFQITKGAVRDIFSDYDNETNSVELIDELKESDLTCSYVGVDKQIKYENDLMAIIQNTIAEDFTFI